MCIYRIRMFGFNFEQDLGPRIKNCFQFDSEKTEEC